MFSIDTGHRGSSLTPAARHQSRLEASSASDLLVCGLHLLLLDINNHLRQGGLALERCWNTQRWDHRVLATLLGIIETDAYLAWNHFHCTPDTSWGHAQFTSHLARSLLLGEQPRELRSTTATAENNQTEDDNPHDIRPLSELPEYKNKKNKHGNKVKALRQCLECNA